MTDSAEPSQPPGVAPPPKLPEVESPSTDDVLGDAPSTEELVDHAQTADEIVRRQPSVEDLIGRDR